MGLGIFLALVFLVILMACGDAIKDDDTEDSEL